MLVLSLIPPHLRDGCTRHTVGFSVLLGVSHCLEVNPSYPHQVIIFRLTSTDTLARSYAPLEVFDSTLNNCTIIEFVDHIRNPSAAWIATILVAHLMVCGDAMAFVP